MRLWRVLNGYIKDIVVHQPGRSNSHVRVMSELLMLTITKHLKETLLIKAFTSYYE